MPTIEQIRALFPAPQGEERVPELLAEFLREVDAKRHGSMIGDHADPGYAGLFREAVFPLRMTPEKEVVRRIADLYSGVPQWSHPLVQLNVLPPPTAISIAAEGLTARFNENSIWDHYGRSAAQAETIAAGMLADLIGYDKEKASGFFTFGGTAGNLYAMQIGIAKADPEAKRRGIARPIHCYCSDVAHYSISTAAQWSGIGTGSVQTVRTDDDGVMDAGQLEKALEQSIASGALPGTIFATMGSTDTFSLDPLREMVELRDRVARRHGIRIHVHADAVIGWPFLALRGDGKILSLPEPLREEIRGIVSRISETRLADSVAVDFHKTGWVPYICSALMLKDAADLQPLARETGAMPYLYHGNGYQPGVFTLETSRPNYAQKALANMLLLGREGYGTLIVHLLGIADYFRGRIDSLPDIALLNRRNPAFVTDFRLYPPGADARSMAALELHDGAGEDYTEKINDYNRRIVLRMFAEGERRGSSLISYTEAFRTTAKGRRILALKSYPMSPFVEPEHMDVMLGELLQAREKVCVP